MEHLLLAHMEVLHRTRMPTSNQDSTDLLRRFRHGHTQSHPRALITALHQLVRTEPRQLVRMERHQQGMQLLRVVIRRIRSKLQLVLTILRYGSLLFGADESGLTVFQAPPYPQAPPPPPQQFYGAPTNYGQPALPSPGYTPGQMAPGDAGQEAEALYRAMKGFGTDERTLIRILSKRDPLQMALLVNTFGHRYGKSLQSWVESETSGYFRDTLVALIRGPLAQDVYNAHRALKGLGTKEGLLNDVVLSRSNADLNAIKQEFQRVHRRPLEQEVREDLSLKTERLFDMVLAARRAEESAPVLPQQVERDVTDVYQATEARVGADQLTVCSIFASRSDGQLRAIAHTYEQRYRKPLDRVIEKVGVQPSSFPPRFSFSFLSIVFSLFSFLIFVFLSPRSCPLLPLSTSMNKLTQRNANKKEFSGHMEDSLLMMLRGATDRAMRDAVLLEATMRGMGTKDDMLLNRIVRCHWSRDHMNQVKGAYRHRFQRELASRIQGETRGDFEKVLLACIE